MEVIVIETGVAGHIITNFTVDNRAIIAELGGIIEVAAIWTVIGTDTAIKEISRDTAGARGSRSTAVLAWYCAVVTNHS